MAWTTLGFAFGSLLTSTKMGQLYDNLTAVAKGDSGAPSIISNAIIDAAVGDFVETCRDDGGSNSDTSYAATGAALTVVRDGAYRVKWSHNGNNASGTCKTKVYKNGGAVGVEKSTSSTTPVEVSDDIAGLVAGDVLQIYAYRTGASTASAVTAMRLCVSEATAINSGGQ